VGVIGDISRISYSRGNNDLEGKARKYDRLGSSKVRIHLIRTSALQETLNTLKSEQMVI